MHMSRVVIFTAKIHEVLLYKYTFFYYNIKLYIINRERIIRLSLGTVSEPVRVVDMGNFVIEKPFFFMKIEYVLFEAIAGRLTVKSSTLPTAKCMYRGRFLASSTLRRSPVAFVMEVETMEVPKVFINVGDLEC